MTTMKFDNLIDVNTGETVEIDIPNDFEIDELPGKRAKEFAERINEATELGRLSGQKLREVFGK